MSREIKFRIWAETDNGNEMIYLGQLECDNGLWFDSPVDHIDKYIQIMQFTGLKDKNGKDIYEGDIMQITRESSFAPVFGDEPENIDQLLTGEVVLIASKGACLRRPNYKCCLSGDTGRLNFYYPIAAYRSEVIGNIHQHKELLK